MTGDGAPATTPVRLSGSLHDARPHEDLGQQTPASHYTSSPRPCSARLLVPDYPRHFLVKTITTDDKFHCGKRSL